MEKDFVYANPPLIEVIAEYHWQLQPLASLPNAAIDPHFTTFEQDLSKRLADNGYSSIESLSPPQIPLELLPHRVVKRYRRSQGTWPCFQAGPGVFTVNTVPPYGGWGGFKQIVADGTSTLYQSYPFPERYLKIDFAELRYINAFKADHGYNDIVSFCEKFLNVRVVFPYELWPDDMGSVFLSTEARIPLKDHPSAFGIMKLAPGQAKGQNAAILELIVRKEAEFSNSETLLQWMDDAHRIVRLWFQTLTTDVVRQLMGPITEIES